MWKMDDRLMQNGVERLTLVIAVLEKENRLLEDVIARTRDLQDDSSLQLKDTLTEIQSEMYELILHLKRLAQAAEIIRENILRAEDELAAYTDGSMFSMANGSWRELNSGELGIIRDRVLKMGLHL